MLSRNRKIRLETVLVFLGRHYRLYQNSLKAQQRDYSHQYSNKIIHVIPVKVKNVWKLFWFFSVDTIACTWPLPLSKLG